MKTLVDVYPKLTLKKCLFLTIALAPIWWILGVSFFIYHAVSIFLWVGLLLISKKSNVSIKFPLLCLILILLIIVYIFSIILNIEDSENIRTIASLYNWSFWLMGLFLIIVVFNIFKVVDIISVLKLFNFILLISGIILVCGVIVWFAGGFPSISFNSPILSSFKFLESFPLVKSSSMITIVSASWLFSVQFPRSSIMSPYPTAAGAIVIMLLPLTIAYNSSLNEEKTKIFMKYCTFILGILILFFSISRFSIFSLLIGFIIVWTIKTKKRSIIFLFLVLLFLLILIPYFGFFFDLFNSIRPGSLTLRAKSYAFAMDMMKEENLMFGIGVKPRLDEIQIPVGSHSTYLGLFLRTGIIGILIFIFFELYLLFIWFINRKKIISIRIKTIWDSIGVSLFAMSFWMIFEDIDAPQLVCFLYFLVIGIMLSMLKNMKDFNEIDLQKKEN